MGNRRERQLPFLSAPDRWPALLVVDVQRSFGDPSTGTVVAFLACQNSPSRR